jgi:PAS domain S-box-containing protein
MIRNLNRWLIIAIIVILASGMVLTLWTVQREENLLRADLLTKTRLVQGGIDTGHVKAFTGTEADLVSPDYQALKGQMIQVQSTDPLIRFIYILGQRPDGTIFFFIDSEPPESGDYSPPGQVYPEASAILLNAFTSGNETTEGPVTDRWGTWVSGLVPIRDSQTGEVIAVVGTDIDARDWTIQIVIASAPAVIAMLLLLLLLLIFFYVQQRNDRERQILTASEAAIKESERRLTDIINFLPDATLVIDREGKVISWNKAIEEMTGVAAKDMLGKGDHEYSIPFYGERRPILIDLVFEENEEIKKKYPFIQRNGNKFISEIYIQRLFGGKGAYVWFIVSPLNDTKGTVIGAIESIRDITERKAIDQIQDQYNAEATRFAEDIKRANDKLNLLNSITRHDILNQLTAILGYLEMMKMKFPDPSLQEYITAEINAAHNIQTQIMFTKDYQDIGSQSPQWFNVKKVILSNAATLPLSQVTLLVHFDNLEIFADPLLEKVFYTLLENALRHGKNVTTIEFTCQTQKEGLVVIYTDNGEGVPFEYKEAILQRKFFKHTGFGLYLSRTILGITGMTIRENGEPGKGARFEILVPKGAFRFTHAE